MTTGSLNNLPISGGYMDKKKVTDLAKSFSLSCKKLVKDKQMVGTLTSPAVVLVSLTIINLISVNFEKHTGWG
jgi:hypothetical protein